MASAGSGSISANPCFSIVAEDAHDETATLSVQDYRAGLQKGTDDVKLSLLRSIVTATLNGRDMVGCWCAGGMVCGRLIELH
jgi:hypothetical protein